MATTKFIRDPTARFWSKVDRSGDCWLWLAYRNKSGYGSVRFNGLMQLAHRVAWQLTHGAIPDDLCVLHRCDNPPCCNPSHLFQGTKMDNVRDMREKGRENYLSGDACYQRQQPERNRRGEQLTWTKLTADSVRAIRSAHVAGTTRMELAKRYGIGWTTVDHVVKRESWKHVE